MRGITVARRAVADFLAADLPGWLDELDVAWGTVIPRPERYLPVEPAVLDRFPLIAVSGVGTPRVRRREYETEPPATLYDATYTLRVFVWVRADGVEATVTQRDDLVTAVRALLIARPTLNVPGEAVLLDEDSVTEEMSDPAPVKGERVVAGAYIGCQVTCAERLRAGSLGTVNTTHVRAEPVPHPALD